MKNARRTSQSIWVGLLPLMVSAWIGCSDETTVMEPNDGGATTPPPIVDLDSVPPAAVNELIVRSPGVRSLALQWIAPGCDGWDGIAVGYDIRYSTSPITEQVWDEAPRIRRIPAPEPAGAVQKCRATRLEPATTYYFAMKSCDAHANESYISNVAYGTTLQESMPPSAVTDLEVSELETGRYLLRWTARGDDGVLGDASKYDIRYHRFHVIDDDNWTSATRVKNVPAPKASGEKESLIIEVPYPVTNHSIAMKVGDEVTNWSTLSNRAMALGTQTYLWTYPDYVSEGEELTIVFRAPGEQQVDVELYYLLGVCGTGEAALYSGTPGTGFYTIKYDFYDEQANAYRDPNWYVISVCIGGERRVVKQVQFTE
jgi:hypothetical protein